MFICHMWLVATTLDNADYGILPHCRKFYQPALLSALLWDLTFFGFYANPSSYCLPLGCPDGYSISSIQRKLPHLQSPWFSSPMAPSFFFPPFFCSPPSRPFHLCVGCHSFSTNCFPAGWSQGLQWCKSRNKKGKEPLWCVESVLRVRNLKTNQVFTLSRWTTP